MVLIPKAEENLFGTNYLLNQTNTVEQRRSNRIGMATLGGKCGRQTWYRFRWARISPLNKRIKRIFDLGHACETLVVESLKEIGIEITRQQEPVEGWGGHIFGLIDGVAIGIPEAPITEHLIEIKSINDRGFNELKKKGVKLAKPEHYTQMMMYAGGLKLNRVMYFAINKNTCEIHVERLHFDEAHYREKCNRAIDIVSSESIPPNFIGDAGNFTCRFCEFVPLCYEGESMAKSCRTCMFVDIEDAGEWSCQKTQKKLTKEEQIEACGSYRSLT